MSSAPSNNNQALSQERLTFTKALSRSALRGADRLFTPKEALKGALTFPL